MKFKNIVLLALILITCDMFSAKLVIIGFKDNDPKTEFITKAFVQFLRQNLEEAKFELMDQKAEGLELAMLKYNMFFLASKNYFEEYENIDLDNSINGSIDYKGKTFYLNVEVYSREKKKLVMKSELKGNKQALLAFFYQVTKEIIASMGATHEVKNIFPIDDDETYFYKYLKFKYEADKLFESDEPDKLYSLIDELDAMKDKFQQYPVFSDLYNELTTQSDDMEKAAGPFDKPFTNVSKPVFAEDSEVEKFARELIVNGYLFSFDGIIQTPVEEGKKDLLNTTVNYSVKFKKSYKNNLIKEIKKRKGNPYFSDMGRFFFSQNNKDCEIFRDFILRQTIVFRLLDANGILIAEAEKDIDNNGYSNGAYRHAKSLPLPLTPRGPANTAFGMVNSSKFNFIFEDIKQADLDRIAKTEIEIKFE